MYPSAEAFIYPHLDRSVAERIGYCMAGIGGGSLSGMESQESGANVQDGRCTVRLRD